MKNQFFRFCFIITSLICRTCALAQHTCVFVGSFNWSKEEEGIYIYEIDTLSGTLKKITSYAGVFNPSYLTVAPTGKYIYACTDSKTPHKGSVSSFEFNYEKRSLRFINSQPSGGENPVYVSVHKNGKWLLEGNYTEGSISVYPLLMNGSIDSAVQHFKFEEGSTNAVRQNRSHIHATVFSPDNNSVFVTDLGADKIRSYAFDTSAAHPLTPEISKSINVSAGSGPRHFTFHPNGNFAYCIEELSGAIEVCAYKNGYLSCFQHIIAHPDEQKEGFESSDIHVSPDGKFLYASNRGKENNIAIFSVLENGTLQHKGYQSTLGEHPRIFELDESGKFLIVANVITGNLIVFSRDPITGLLKKSDEITGLKNPSCVKIWKYKTVE